MSFFIEEENKLYDVDLIDSTSTQRKLRSLEIKILNRQQELSKINDQQSIIITILSEIENKLNETKEKKSSTIKRRMSKLFGIQNPYH